MAEITTRSCDVHGTLKAKRYRIEIMETDTPAGGGEEFGNEWIVDLSERAYTALVRKIEAGIKPPVRREPKEGADDGK